MRQVYTRLVALPHEAPIWRVIEDEQKRADAERKECEIHQTLAQFRPHSVGGV